jgi:hypothetical protein
MHVSGKGRNAGEYWRKEGFIAFAKNILDYNADTFKLEVCMIFLER